MTPATVLAKYEWPICEAVRRDMADREFLDLCDAESKATSNDQSSFTITFTPELSPLLSQLSHHRQH